MGRYKNPHYQRDWMRRERAAHPEKYTVAGGRKSRATREQMLPGQCRKCRKVFPQTAEFFVLLKKKSIGWQGWSAECRSCRNKRFRSWYAKDPAVQVKRVSDYVKNNPHAKAAKNSRDIVRYARRKKKHGCPPWADQKSIQAFYVIADLLTKRTGIAYEVDHIYPLVHPLCSGLHVPWNLRVITAKANQTKGNRLPTIGGQFGTADCGHSLPES
jgi:hypothetical protein